MLEYKECPYCGHNWIPRTESIRCPHCYKTIAKRTKSGVIPYQRTNHPDNTTPKGGTEIVSS